MKKIRSLMLLINTLSKSEKKSIYLHSDLTKGEKAYIELFRLIDKQKIDNVSKLSEEFSKKYSKASFHPEVKYLYDFILNVLVKVKIGQDKNFSLSQRVMYAKILKERNLDTDYYLMLQSLEKEAEEISDYHILLEIRRLELNYLRTNYFEDISEKMLLKKQHKANDTLKILRQINEQSSLYELLLHRLEKTSVAQFDKQKTIFNDLVVSEISLVSNLNRDVFEIQKLHQLFQAQYLSAVGDHKSALNSFIELDKLFANNQILWNNPPLYYLSVLEGILDSLLQNKMYDEIPYFLDKLKSLDYPFLNFQVEIICICFIYNAAIYIGRNEYTKCLDLIDEYYELLFRRMDALTPHRYLQLSLHTAIIYLLNKKFSLARKQLSQIMLSDSCSSLKQFRIVQLINLIVYYELGDIDYITSQIRSLKRQNKIRKKVSRLENMLFYFLEVDFFKLNVVKKEELSQKIENEFELIEQSNEGRFLLSIFDFKQWMISHLKI